MKFMEQFQGERHSRSRIYNLNAADPASELVDRAHLDEHDVEQISQVMEAMGRLRHAEQQLSDASLKYMKLNSTDMRALHYLIVCGNEGTVATPGVLASHLGISSASTTKLLDRLERGGHIVRAPHPTDRRALAISVTKDTRRAAMETVGKQHAKRFNAVARLTSEERAVVIRFLDDMAEEITLRNEPWATAE